jgi:hypothetical protein
MRFGKRWNSFKNDGWTTFWVGNGASWSEDAKLKREKLFMKAVSSGLRVAIFEPMVLEEGLDRGFI